MIGLAKVVSPAADPIIGNTYLLASYGSCVRSGHQCHVSRLTERLGAPGREARLSASFGRL